MRVTIPADRSRPSSGDRHGTPPETPPAARACSPLLLFGVESELRAQFLERLRATLTRLRPAKRLHEALRVLRRAKEMCRFDQAPQLVGGDQCHVVPTSPMDDHLFPVLRHLVEQRLQIRTRLRVGSFDGHPASGDMYSQTVPCSFVSHKANEHRR